MDWEPIKCYLCDKESEEILIYDKKGYKNLKVRPASWSKDPCKCGFYLLTHTVLEGRMDKQKNILISKQRTPLTENQKSNLINYVKKNQDPTGKEPTKIDKSTFDTFTQKILKSAR